LVFDTRDHCTHPWRLGAGGGCNAFILRDPRIALHLVPGRARMVGAITAPSGSSSPVAILAHDAADQETGVAPESHVAHSQMSDPAKADRRAARQCCRTHTATPRTCLGHRATAGSFGEHRCRPFLGHYSRAQVHGSCVTAAAAPSGSAPAAAPAATPLAARLRARCSFESEALVMPPVETKSVTPEGIRVKIPLPSQADLTTLLMRMKNIFYFQGSVGVPSGNLIDLWGFWRVPPPIPNRQGFNDGGVTAINPQLHLCFPRPYLNSHRLVQGWCTDSFPAKLFISTPIAAIRPTMCRHIP
jgi:hypothetical protein